jgi:hypothetical protein
MSDICSIRRNRIVAWQPSVEMASACVAIFKAFGGQMGSVEFLTETDHATELKKQPTLLSTNTVIPDVTSSLSTTSSITYDEPTLLNTIFFDINLVSTLPDPAKVIDKSSLWKKPTNFYNDMALYCLSHQR